jgi:hypothetical protein
MQSIETNDCKEILEIWDACVRVFNYFEYVRIEILHKEN